MNNHMNQKGFTSIVLIVLVVILAGAVGYFTLRKPVQESIISPTNNLSPSQNSESSNLTVGSNIAVTGVVIENNTSCIIDAHCTLKLRTNGGLVNVLYNPGRSLIQCINLEITETSLKIKNGEKVEVYGKVTDKNSISTCDSKEFYIKRK